MSCVVTGCKNRKPGFGISYHRIPIQPTLRKLWLGAIGREDWDPPRGSKICSSHFKPEDFNRTYHSGKVYLRPNAVPFLHLKCQDGPTIKNENGPSIKIEATDINGTPVIAYVSPLRLPESEICNTNTCHNTSSLISEYDAGQTSFPASESCSTSLPESEICNSSLPVPESCNTISAKSETCNTSFPVYESCNTNLLKSEKYNTSFPVSESCNTNFPKSEICNTSLPVSELCNTSLPKSETCNTSFPVSEPCNTILLKSETCNTSLPAFESCNTSFPVSELCNTILPKSETCNTSLPVSESCNTNLHKSETYNTSLSKSESCNTSFPMSESCNINLSASLNTNSFGTYLCNINPIGYDLQNISFVLKPNFGLESPGGESLAEKKLRNQLTIKAKKLRSAQYRVFGLKRSIKLWKRKWKEEKEKNKILSNKLKLYEQYDS